jgi:hypothetical protein
MIISLARHQIHGLAIKKHNGQQIHGANTPTSNHIKAHLSGADKTKMQRPTLSKLRIDPEAQAF